MRLLATEIKREVDERVRLVCKAAKTMNGGGGQVSKSDYIIWKCGSVPSCWGRYAVLHIMFRPIRVQEALELR